MTARRTTRAIARRMTARRTTRAIARRMTARTTTRAPARTPAPAPTRTPAPTRRTALLALAGSVLLLAGCGDDGLGARPSRVPDEGPLRTVPAEVTAGTGYRTDDADDADAVMPPRPDPRRSGPRMPPGRPR
jgi:hypothetical protein